MSDYARQHGWAEPTILTYNLLSWHNQENQAGNGPNQPDQNLRSAVPRGKVHRESLRFKYSRRILYFATNGAIPPILLSIQFLRCEM